MSKETTKIIGNVAGLYSCFLLQGILQEGIYNTVDPITGIKFKFPIFLVSLNCLFNLALAIFIKQRTKEESIYLESLLRSIRTLKKITVNKPIDQYVPENKKANILLLNSIYLGHSYLFSMIFSNYALTQVSYTLQVVIKSAKAVPVILGGTIFFRKKYSLIDYLSVICITSSLLLFQLPKLLRDRKLSSTIYGYFALSGSLLCDSLTGPRQDYLQKEYNLSFVDNILLLNLPAVILSFATSLLIEGITPYYMLKLMHHTIILKITLFLVCATFGQLFIIKVLTDLGSLNLTIITTIRKFVAILLSIIIYKHKMSPLQYFAIFLLLLSGTFKSLYGKFKYKID